MPKKDSLDTLRTLFAEKKVLNMPQILVALSVTARYTAYRYLRELHHLTSYTHNGMYYTLPDIAQFNPDGFWYFADIGFSIHGTLANTLYQVISKSTTGKSNCELEKHFRTNVQAALRTLLQTKKISRVKPVNRLLYVNADPVISDCQVKKRTEVGPRQRLPDWIVSEILIETIRSCTKMPSVKDIAVHLAKRASTITHEQVKQVFEEYDLEKKLWIDFHSVA